ncbi:hypothetical protein NVP1101O_154 [Vibrio phage 1.101.O._10N.261.45.C6]|nr:hypothetical protein NVP1101O_154 [Vibrio phage 1.101.O._10N.261.45.C6]
MSETFPPNKIAKNKPIREALVFDHYNMSPDQLVERRLARFTKDDLYINIPARVINTDDYESIQAIDVQLAYNIEDEDYEIDYAVTVKKVQVKLEGGGGFYQKFPVKKGDLVTLHYSHKSLNKFLNSDGKTPLTVRGFELWAGLRDCWATLGFATRVNNQSPSVENYVLEGDNTLVVITPNGKYTIDTKDNIDITSSGDVTINCNKAIINAPKSEFTGDVKVDGTLTVEGVSTFKAGVLAPTYGGYGGAGSMTIGTVNASVNVTINGKAVKGHNHDGKVPPF